MNDWYWLGDQALGWKPKSIPPDEFWTVSQSALEYFIQRPPKGIREIVPGFQSLTFLLHNQVLPSKALSQLVQDWLEEVPRLPNNGSTKVIEIPVHYNGPDLAEVARLTNLSVPDVIRLHSAPLYRVHFLGFLPGFPYLGGMDPKLFCPRRSIPRRLVPAGTVGIGGMQTGVYPQDSPGGWQWIGQTPLSLFSRQTGPLLALGDAVQFVPL